MEQHQFTRPVLMTGVKRKFGRCDFKRFDNAASSPIRAGRGKIGKIEVDCKFIFTESHWGLLGPDRKPGGILYLDLDFRQPSDCKLRSATVLVTLEEDVGEGNDSETAWPVKFTDHYGPKHFRGIERSMRTKQTKNFTPTIQVLGHGAGGLGIDTEKTTHTASRWRFSGHISSSEGSIWYNTLRWELEENLLETQPMHSNVIHTAFALEHNARKFYMTVKVSGKLAHRSDRFKNKFKFGGGLTKEQETVTTMFVWSSEYSCPLILDKLAESLPLAMEYKNRCNVAVEIPDAQQADYFSTSTAAGGAQFQEATNQPPGLGDSQTFPGLGDRTWSGAGLPSSTPTAFLRMSDAEPTNDNMGIAAGFLTAQPIMRRGRETYQASEFSTAVTLVENVGESTSGRSSAFRSKAKAVDEEMDKQLKRQHRRDDGAVDAVDAMLLLQWLAKIGLIALGLIAELFGLRLGSGYESPAFEVQDENDMVKENGRSRMSKAGDPRFLIERSPDESDEETSITPGFSPTLRKTAFKSEFQALRESRAERFPSSRVQERNVVYEP